MSLSARPVRLGLLGMFTSPWLSLASLCCCNRWSPVDPNILRVGKWLPQFRVIHNISLLGFGTLRSVCGFGTCTLLRSRERSGYFHTTSSGAICVASAVFRSMRVEKSLRSHAMKRCSGSFDVELFLVPSDSFISCVTSSRPTDIPIELLSSRREGIAQWQQLAGTAVFTSLCQDLSLFEENVSLGSLIVSAVSCLSRDDGGATLSSGAQQDSFMITPKSVCSAFSRNSSAPFVLQLSAGQAFVSASRCGPAVCGSVQQPSCNAAHHGVLTAGQNAASMPLGIQASCCAAGRRNVIDLSKSCIANGCPLGRYPILNSDFFASVASRCSLSHWHFDFGKARWPCSVAQPEPSCAPPTPSWLASSSTYCRPHLFTCHNHEGVKAEHNLHLLACAVSSCSQGSVVAGSAGSLTPPTCCSEAEPSSSRFCGSESFCSLLSVFRERTLALSADEERDRNILNLASSVRSSFHKQILIVSKSHQLSFSPNSTESSLGDEDASSSCSLTSHSPSLRHGVSVQDPVVCKQKVRRKRPRFIISTYNGNSWKNLKSYLMSTSANIVCTQEHRLLGDLLADARLWARSNGWQSFWAPAARTTAGSTSGGVAVFVKAHVQAWLPQQVDPIFCAHRGIGVVVNAGNLGPVLVISAYFVTNNTAKNAVAPSNLRILTVMGDFIQQTGIYACIGADWQMEPGVLSSQTMFLETLAMDIRCDRSGLGSCLFAGGKSSSNIDYFVMHKQLCDVCERIEISDSMPPRPHRPVVLSFCFGPRDVQVQIIKEPKKLPVDSPIGLALPLHMFADYSGVVDPSLSSLKPAGGDVYKQLGQAEVASCTQLLEASLSRWFSKAEADLLGVFGSTLAPDSRGEIPKILKINLINTFRSPQGAISTQAKALRWAQFRFQEVAFALRSWVDSKVYPASISSLRRIQALVKCTLVNGIVQSPFAVHDLLGKKVWHPKLKSVLLQVHELQKVTGFRRPNSSIALAIAARSEMFATRASAAAGIVENDDLSSRSQAWKEWVALAGNASAATAHRYTKAPLSLNKTDFCGTSKSRTDELQDEVSAWSLLWKEGGGTPPPVFNKVPGLPPLSVEKVVSASKSFKRGTCALGGLHPRHVALLSVEAIAALIDILEASEAVGAMPPQLMASLIALLPKASGGLRPIVWAQSIFRVWSRARLDLVKSLEVSKTYHLPFAAQKNRGPTDIVWRHAFKAECAQTNNSHFVCLLWDLHKCYEMVGHTKLIAAAIKHDYPLAILRICIHAYRSPRRIIYKGIVSRPIFAEQGILAGVSTATSELRLLLIDVLTMHAVSHPNVSLNVYIDDIVLDSTSISKSAVIEDMTCAAQDMLVMLEDGAELPIARNKSAVISNSKTTAASLRRSLGDLGGPALGSIRSLGVDFWGGNPGRASKKPVRALRRATFRKRKYRLRALASASKPAAAKVYFCGVIPSLLFDAPVYGLFGNDLKVMRRDAGAISGLRGRRKSPNLAFLFDPLKDPEVVSALPLVQRFCREVWNAALPPAHREAAGLSLGTLAEGVSGYLRSNSNPPFCFRRVSNGPVSALHRVLVTAGWRFVSPFQFVTKYGLEIHVPTTSPSRICSMFKADLLETIARRDIVGIHMRRDTPESRLLMDNGVFWQPLRTVYNHLSKERRITLQNIVTNGIWTNTDLADAGYSIDPICTSCNSGLDTIFHRCFTCISVEQRAKLALGDDLFNKVIGLGEDSLLANRCLMPLPAMSSAPSSKTLYDTIGMSVGDTFSASEGEIFGDGSCLYPTDQPLARAGFSCVQIRPDGSLLKGCFGCVPGTLPQSSLAGEYSALSCAYDNTCQGDQGTYVGDCQDVLSGFTRGICDVLHSTSPHACTWRIILQRYPDWESRIGAVAKVKAHSAEPKPGCSQQEFLRYWGNYHADLLAKQGAALHAPTSEDIKSYKADKKDLTNLAYHMVDTLADVRLSRISGAVKVDYLPRCAKPVVKHVSSHAFRWQDNLWVCSLFFLRTSSLSSSNAQSRCKGMSPLTRVIDANAESLGHKLWITANTLGAPLLYCSHCWCYAAPHPRNLMRPCARPRLGIRPCAKFHLVNCRHPRSHTRLLRPIRLHVIS